MNIETNEIAFRVRDLFKFNNGTTIFVIEFPFSSSPNLPCNAQILLGEKIIEIVKLTSLNLPYPSSIKDVLSVSTDEPVKLIAETVKQQPIFLKFKL